MTTNENAISKTPLRTNRERPKKEERGPLHFLTALLAWSLFCITILTIAYFAFAAFNPEVWLLECALAGCVVWGITDGAQVHVSRRLLLGVLGAALGAFAAIILDIIAFPSAVVYGRLLVEAGVILSTFGCCMGVFVGRLFSHLPLPKISEIPKHLVFMAGTGVCAAVFFVPASVVVFGLLGVPGVYVGMAGTELHVRLKTDVPALQDWLESMPTDVAQIPKESWPEGVQKLKPTGVFVKQGRLYLRFAYGRLHDDTIIIRPRSQCVHWYDSVQTRYVEH